MAKRQLTRRQFLIVGTGLAAGSALAACAAPAATPAPSAPEAPAATTAPEAPAAEAAPTAEAAAAASKYQEAPMLAELVQAGTLPPVDERLPDEPYVAGQGELVGDQYLQLKPGIYGGTMNLAQESPGGDPHIFIGMNEPLLWAPDGFDYSKGIHGSILTSYQANAENTEFTFTLRKGLKWSDGAPVTTEDAKFAFDDVLFNEEITPVFPAYLRTGMRGDGTPAKLEVVDDFTFKIIFDKPYGSFPAQLAIGQWRSYVDIIKPKHYLKQFHKNYASEEDLQKMAEEAQVPEATWFNLFNAKAISGNLWKAVTEQGIGHPTLTPWIITKVDTGVFTYERNPYYFKVDADGKQLPYIDKIVSQVVTDKETLTTRALTGDFDYLGERSSMKKLPLMKEQEEAGKIKILIPRMHRLPINFDLNLTFNGPDWRAVTGDVRFRRALSYAINRPEILDSFYFNEFATLPEKTNPIEYDPDQANKLLDEMGLDKKDADGFRLGPNGQRFDIIFEVGDLSEDHAPMAELISEYWQKVGIYTMVKKGDWNAVTQKWNVNELMATDLWAHEVIWRSGGWDDYLPSNYWGQQWATWYTSNGNAGEEPPPEIKALYDHHAAFIAATPGSPEAEAEMDAIYQSYRDNVWTFNVVENSYYPTFFNVRLQNVPTGKYEGLGIVVMYSMEQWFFEG